MNRQMDESILLWILFLNDSNIKTDIIVQFPQNLGRNICVSQPFTHSAIYTKFYIDMIYLLYIHRQSCILYYYH